MMACVSVGVGMAQAYAQNYQRGLGGLHGLGAQHPGKSEDSMEDDLRDHLKDWDKDFLIDEVMK